MLHVETGPLHIFPKATPGLAEVVAWLGRPQRGGYTLNFSPRKGWVIADFLIDDLCSISLDTSALVVETVWAGRRGAPQTAKRDPLFGPLFGPPTVLGPRGGGLVGFSTCSSWDSNPSCSRVKKSMSHASVTCAMLLKTLFLTMWLSCY